ncbi:alpha/beta fold hydrolase [Celeribacter arenosi]|uniref:Alpha/beta hydrolase n=1 Tax=Celeribacter arenosi TaxID=792649 RepID=A0ABP7KA26_9RHOB
MSDALVFLPGFMADGRVFTDQIADLSADRAVMAMPLQGGDLDAMATAVLAGAPPRFALAGHDLGATVATEVFRRAPDRVTGLALICASAQAEPPPAAAAREPRMIKARTGRLGEALIEDMPTSALFAGPNRNAIRDYWIDIALAKGVDAYLAQSRLMQRRPDVQSILRRARVPALIIGGAADTICPPRRQDFIAQLMPRAQVMVIEKAGHLPMLEAPMSVSRALRNWLDTTSTLVLT